MDDLVLMSGVPSQSLAQYCWLCAEDPAGLGVGLQQIVQLVGTRRLENSQLINFLIARDLGGQLTVDKLQLVLVSRGLHPQTSVQVTQDHLNNPGEYNSQPL